MTAMMNGQIGDVALTVDKMLRVRDGVVGRRVRDIGYYQDDTAWTGEILEIKPNGKATVRWDDDESVEDVPVNFLQFLDHGHEEDVEAIKARILNKFATLEKLVRGVAQGYLTGAIVSGQGGIGKTYTVEQQLNLHLGTDAPTESNPTGKRYHKVTGHITPLGLYETLFEYSGANDVIVFDDCDSVWGDTTATNLLKAALDTHPHRVLFWQSKSRQLEAPTSFVFRGRIIFLTNKRLQGEHFKALMTRVHGIDLHMTPVELIHRIEDIVATMDYKDCPLEQRMECVSWLRDNLDRFQTIDVRTVIKLIDYRLMDDEGWQDMADALLVDFD